MYCLNNLGRRILKCFLCLLRGNSDRSRKSRDKVTSAYIHCHNLRSRICASYLNLYILSRSLTDEKIMLLTHITHDGIVKIGGQDKSWKDFFDKAEATLAKCGKKFLEIVNSLWKPDLKPDPAQRETEKTLLVASKTQSTTTDNGWLLNTDEVFASRYNTNTIRVVLQESVGLIDPDTNDPVFKKIEWSVNGFKSDGTPLSASGTQKQSVSGDKLLRSDTIGGTDGYFVYYFEIPYDLDQGNYTIVMKLYEHESDVATSQTITVRSAG